MSLQFHRPERQQNPLQCSEHPNEQITNYCSALDCLKPLCPECNLYPIIKGMSSHNILHKQKHTYPEVESIRGVINNSQKRLKEAGVSFQKEIINIENQIQYKFLTHEQRTVGLSSREPSLDAKTKKTNTWVGRNPLLRIRA